MSVSSSMSYVRYWAFFSSDERVMGLCCSGDTPKFLPIKSRLRSLSSCVFFVDEGEHRRSCWTVCGLGTLIVMVEMYLF